VVIHLANALRERYSHTGHESDLDAAIRQGQTALANCNTESTLCPTVLVMHASILEKNFQRKNDYDELRRAESMCRRALTLCPTACTLSATAYHILGWIMLRLYDGYRTSAYLDEAFNLQRRGLKLESASNSSEDHLYLRSLAAYTLMRYVDLGDPQDVDDAMSLLEQALELCPPMHINRMLIVQTILNVVERRYHLSGRLENLNEAIDLGRKTIAAPNLPHGDRRLGFLNALANLLFTRYETGMSTDRDLEESINLRREVLKCVLPSSMFRWVYAANLADNLRLQFTQKGELHDLEESIELCRHAIDLLPEGRPERPKRFSSLGKALCHRFHETREAADLNEALISCRYAIAAMSPLHVDY
jgi:tetratricopeptide (TPR) repeat protein